MEQESRRSTTRSGAARSRLSSSFQVADRPSPASFSGLSSEALNLELNARNLPTQGSRQARIARLRASNDGSTSAVSRSPTEAGSNCPQEPTVEETGFTTNQLCTLSNMIADAVRSSWSGQPETERLPPSAPATQQQPQPTLVSEEEHCLTGELPRFCSHLSDPIISKIKRGSFVELSSLLPPTDTPAPEPAFKCVQVAPSQDNEDEGIITVATVGPPRRKVRDMSSWLEAWTTYAAVVVAWNPQRAGELLAYQDTILSAFRQFRPDAVLAYDRSFRLLAEKDLSFPWDRRDTDLYTKIFTGQGLRNPDYNNAGTHPFRAGGGVGRALPRTAQPVQHYKKTADGEFICRNFNARKCTTPKCRYAHCCFVCRGPHSAAEGLCDAAVH